MNTERLLESAVAWTTRQLQKRVPYSPSNPYLEGPFAPVASEVTDTQLRVTGHIPRGLNGIFTRIGPNPMQVENPATYHWFLGDGMVHGLRLRDGAALWYRNRWVGTDSVNRRLGRPLAAGSRRGTADVVNTNIIGHNGRLWALVEAGALPVELDSELNTIRHSYFESPLSRAFAAHPHRDPVTGEVHAICYDALYHHQVRHVVIDRQGAVTRDVSIPVRHGPMIHDCAITQRYVLIFDLPITFSYGALLRGAGFPYQWNARHPPRVGLLSRTGLATAIRWFDVDPCYVFHAANAYELDDGAVIVDVVVYPRLFEKSRQGPENTATHLERWRLDATSGHVQRHVFSDDRQEFPRFDERRTGGQYRYAYTVGLDVQHTGAQPLYQCDLDTGRVSRHNFGPSHIPSETVFVPRTEGGAENDGWLLAYVSDLRAGTSTVVILNAQDIGGEPQAVIGLPVRVPVGFHGNWIADER